MKKFSFFIVLSFFLISNSFSGHQNEPYEPHNWDKFLVKGSENYYKFQSELVVNLIKIFQIHLQKILLILPFYQT